ncbi:hypothetical protein PHOSAC3_140129 [Mesotoga infera]|nr:hypothetical protein PHOSAC3_140129 [Mesotoga infera]
MHNRPLWWYVCFSFHFFPCLAVFRFLAVKVEFVHLMEKRSHEKVMTPRSNLNEFKKDCFQLSVLAVVITKEQDY